MGQKSSTEFLDIPWEFQTNPQFRRELEYHGAAIARLEDAAEKGEDASGALGQHLLEILRLCDFNPGMLVPYYFPAYPEKEPLSLFARPFSFAMFNLQIGASITIRASRQIGKCITFSNLHKVKVDNKAAIEVNTEKLFALCEQNSNPNPGGGA